LGNAEKFIGRRIVRIKKIAATGKVFPESRASRDSMSSAWLTHRTSSLDGRLLVHPSVCAAGVYDALRWPRTLGKIAGGVYVG
jgi:hypothetical protein